MGLLLYFSSLRFGCVAFAVGRPVQNADRIGFEFDDELLHDVLDDFLAVRNFDRAIVFAGGQFALYEDMSAFGEDVPPVWQIRLRTHMLRGINSTA